MNDKIHTPVPTLDARNTYKDELNKIREKLKLTNTMTDVEIDPHGDVLGENGDPDETMSNHEFEAKIRNIMNKHKKIFGADIGVAANGDFTVTAEISGKVPRNTGHAQKQYSQAEKDAGCKKLDEEIANGILINAAENNIPILNVLPQLPIPKKDDDGNIIDISKQLRIVSDCGRAINPATDFQATFTDELQPCLNNAALYSSKGYCMKLDISQCYHSFPLAKHLWGYFVVQHPERGAYAYCRAVQGWNRSGAAVRDNLFRIFYDFRKNMSRLMDDVFLWAKSRQQFLDLME